MKNALKHASGAALFLAGAAAVALTRRSRQGNGDAAVNELARSVRALESRLDSQEAANSARFNVIEAQLEQHAAKLAQMPSTAQIVAAMEPLLSRTLAPLDERIRSQARTIETLKTAASQTDGLLERVLESLVPPEASEGSGLESLDLPFRTPVA